MTNDDRRKVAAIVGGGGGIGGAMAQTLARRGYRVALVDRDPERMQLVRESLGSASIDNNYVCDIANETEAAASVLKVGGDMGRIDLLVQAAGLTQVSPCASTGLDVYRRVMEVNFFGVVATTKAALPRLLETKGRIAVLSSICGFAPLVGRTGYCASKHALHGFFETLRCELDGTGVSVTLVCPSFVATDFATRGLSGDGSPMAFERSTTGRSLDPLDVAEAIARAAERRQRLLILGRQGKWSHWLTRICPPLYDRLMSRRFRVELSRL